MPSPLVLRSLGTGLAGPGLGSGGDGGDPQFGYTVSITAPAQTTTPKFTFGAGAPAAVVDWGDGSPTSAVTSDVELTHAYANIGTYTVTLRAAQQSKYLTKLDISTDRATTLINLHNMASLKELRSAFNVASLAVAVSGLPAGLTVLSCYGGSNAITGPVSGLPSNVVTVKWYGASNAPSAGAPPSKVHDINLANNGLSQSVVDGILNAMYAARASYTDATPVLTIGGTNAAPSGVYQSVTPPTTGKEAAYDLVNDPTAQGYKKWTITFTA